MHALLTWVKGQNPVCSVKLFQTHYTLQFFIDLFRVIQRKHF